MSKLLRIAFVVEGPTDLVLLEAVVQELLEGRDFEPVYLTPLVDENLRAKNAGGWGGVYFWCRQIVEQANGPARNNPLFAMEDTIVVIHVDADIARRRYADYEITDAPNNDLPCEQSCPPPSATTDALRTVLLGWLGESSAPPGVVVCIPSKSIETWLLVGLFPDNEEVGKGNVECRWGFEVQLRKHGLIRGKQKLINEYIAKAEDFRNAWSEIRGKCDEAERFSAEFLAAKAAH